MPISNSRYATKYEEKTHGTVHGYLCARHASAITKEIANAIATMDYHANLHYLGILHINGTRVQCKLQTTTSMEANFC